MNRYILTIIIILVSICLMKSQAIACTNGLPTPVIDNPECQYVCVYYGQYNVGGYTAYFDGTSSVDTDESGFSICAWEWDIYKDNILIDYGVFPYPTLSYYFGQTGYYEIRLWVLDDEGSWSSTYAVCHVLVMDVTLTSESSYSAYGSGKEFTYDIIPGLHPHRWKPDYAWFWIDYQSFSNTVYFDDLNIEGAPGFYLVENEPPIYWDGRDYDDNWLEPGSCHAIVEVGKWNDLSDTWAYWLGDDSYLGYSNTYFHNPPQFHFNQIKVDLDAEYSNDDTEETPGTPVMLNDDWDCEVTYGSTSGDHRVYEPIWDKDYTDSFYDEDDLMPVNLIVTGVYSGTAYLNITSGSDNIRLWENEIKYSSPISIPTGGKPYDVAILPQTIYVEGKALGSAVMTLTYSAEGNNFTDTIKIDVVSLEAYQDGWTKKVINKYDTDIIYVVEPESLSSYYHYFWDVNGDGTRHEGSWESSTLRAVNVKYSSENAGPANVKLRRTTDNNNHRKVYDISVELTGGLVIHKNIKVALDKYVGTDLTEDVSSSDEEKNTEIENRFSSWDNTHPIIFDNTGDIRQSIANMLFGLSPYEIDIIDNGYRIQYSPKLDIFGGIAGVYSVYYDPHLYIFGVFVGPYIYDYDVKEAELISIVNHESKHCDQLRQAKINDPAGNFYHMLYSFYRDSARANPFLEAEAYLTNIQDNTAGLYLLDSYGGGGFLDQFAWKYYYAYLTGINIEDPNYITDETTRAAAKTFLQSLYLSIPYEFIEMKKDGYDYFMLPP
jgi:hypothetical protein